MTLKYSFAALSAFIGLASFLTACGDTITNNEYVTNEYITNEYNT